LSDERTGNCAFSTIKGLVPPADDPGNRSAVVSDARRRGFSLVELLVVTAIIVLLISILMSSLAKARYQVRLTVCMNHLKQLGTGITTYAHNEKVIPHGPDVQPLEDILQANDGTMATSQIWTGPQKPVLHLMAHGLLITKELLLPDIMYCPGDDSNDPVEELDKVVNRKISPAYSSYLYRQLDETNQKGKLEKLGKNSVGERARALALDMNSLITAIPGYRRTNHKARKINVLYYDGSVHSLINNDNMFCITDEHLMDIPSRLKEILQGADADY